MAYSGDNSRTLLAWTIARQSVAGSEAWQSIAGTVVGTLAEGWTLWEEMGKREASGIREWCIAIRAEL